MADAWTVEFFVEGDRCPVRDFLDGLEPAQRAKLLALIKLLEEYGPTLPFPYSSQAEGKLRELRAHYGETQYRVLYFGSLTRSFVLLSAFTKRTDRIPPAEIEVGRKRMRQWTERATPKRRGKRR